MTDPQVPESFPPDAQAVIDSLRQELKERNQELHERNQQLQQALNEKSQLVLERDLLVNQLLAQCTQRHGLEAQAMIASQNDTTVTRRGNKRAHTEMEEEATTAGMMVTWNNEASGMLGATAGSLAAFNADSRYAGPIPFELRYEKKASNTGPFPVELWTNVLGFLPYSDVCRMTRVAKVFRKDVMDTLKTLYIDNEKALFHYKIYYGRNVQEVIFACIFEDFEPPVGDEPGRFTLKSWVHSSKWFLHVFLINFLKVKYVFVAKANGETKQQVLRRLSLQGDVEAGYDYVDSIPRGHINFVQPRDDGDRTKSAFILRGLANCLFIDPIVHTNLPVRMVHGLPRVHRGNSCLGGGCNHDGCKYVFSPVLKGFLL